MKIHNTNIFKMYDEMVNTKQILVVENKNIKRV